MWSVPSEAVGTEGHNDADNADRHKGRDKDDGRERKQKCSGGLREGSHKHLGKGVDRRHVICQFRPHIFFVCEMTTTGQRTMGPTTLGGLGQLAGWVNKEVMGKKAVVVQVLAQRAYRVAESGLVDRRTEHTDVKGRLLRVHCPRASTRLKHLPDLADDRDAIHVTIQERRTGHIYLARLCDVAL